VAASILDRADNITSQDILRVVRTWGFEKNTQRGNVFPKGHKYVSSDTFGVRRGRDGGIYLMPETPQYANVPRLLLRYMKQKLSKRLRRDVPDLIGTSIALNWGFGARRHRDLNNDGPSAIIACGTCKGGRLIYFPNDTGDTKLEDLKRSESLVLDIYDSVCLMDGCKAHEVEPYSGGERCSIVLYCATGWQRLDENTKRKLRECEFNLPTEPSLIHLRGVMERSIGGESLGVPGHTDSWEGEVSEYVPKRWRRGALASGPLSSQVVVAAKSNQPMPMAKNLPEGVTLLDPSKDRAKPYDLPDGWVTGFKYTSGGNKVKVAVSPTGSLHWDIRFMRRASETAGKA